MRKVPQYQDAGPHAATVGRLTLTVRTETIRDTREDIVREKTERELGQRAIERRLETYGEVALTTGSSFQAHPTSSTHTDSRWSTCNLSQDDNRDLRASIVAVRESLAEARAHMSDVTNVISKQLKLELQQIRRKHGQSEDRFSQSLSILEDRMETRLDDISRELDSYRQAQQHMHEEIRQSKVRNRAPVAEARRETRSVHTGAPREFREPQRIFKGTTSSLAKKASSTVSKLSTNTIGKQMPSTHTPSRIDSTSC
eukprot:scaffold1504_cov417-Prasinococcus_capsulatus_cf.AAC.37